MLITSPEFELCLPFVLKEEGGFSNTKGDHGGATNDGIIQSEYNIYRHFEGLMLQSVKLISSDEYREIYWMSYWMPHCQSLPAGLNLSVFNINVNGGGGRGTRLIQQILGCHVDGNWGGETDFAVKNMIAKQNAEAMKSLIVSFHDAERAFYDAIIAHDPSQRKFASDWFGRNDRCEKLSLTMVK